MTESLLAQVRKRGSLVPIFWSANTLMMTALSCCLNVMSFDVAAVAEAEEDETALILLLLFLFFEGVRLVVRITAAPLANNRGDLRS